MAKKNKVKGVRTPKGEHNSKMMALLDKVNKIKKNTLVSEIDTIRQGRLSDDEWD